MQRLVNQLMEEERVVGEDAHLFHLDDLGWGLIDSCSMIVAMS